MKNLDLFENGGTLLQLRAGRLRAGSKLLADLLVIDQASGIHPALTPATLRSFLRCSNCQALAVCDPLSERLRGFLLLTRQSVDLSLQRFAVLPDDRRMGVGSLLVEEAKLLLTPPQVRIVAHVPERALGAQLFLRARGFRCLRTDPSPGDQGLYLFCFGPCPGDNAARSRRPLGRHCEEGK